MGKTILVTGGAGFIGSHLCRRLVEEGHTVISLDNYFTGSKDNHVSGVDYREGHTKDIETLVPETPELVYHLGEYSRTEKSFEDIETMWDLNVAGTFAVLEFVRRRNAKLIYAGSSTKFSDDGLGRDQSPYAWSKAVNTEFVRNYGAWFGIRFAITYFYNVYGPGERADAFGTLIEIFRQSYLAGRPLGVVAPGDQRRNFTHVDDIVDGLILVGENGEGDEFGLGNEHSYSVREVADLFGSTTVMLPARAGNRMTSPVDTKRAQALGWKTKRELADYIEEFKRSAKPAKALGVRVLVFSTTYHPVEGPAEHALRMLSETMPDVTFDIITTKYRNDLPVEETQGNVHIYRVGNGTPLDKFFLPLLGARTARTLMQKHSYLFSWSVMASYAALAALFSRKTKVPLLVTLADQRLTWYAKLFLRLVMGNTDQVYASLPIQERDMAPLRERMHLRRSIGGGDSFANALRFAYSSFLNKGK